jgi:hypothetical protein
MVDGPARGKDVTIKRLHHIGRAGWGEVQLGIQLLLGSRATADRHVP